MRILRVALFLFGLAGCGGPSAAGPAVRLAASDTILINSHWPTALPVHALDAEGRTIVGAPIRFERVNGAALPVTSAGAVTCARSGDLSVRAVLETLTTRVVVRCQLVEYVRVQGMQFILGDSQLSQPRTLAAAAYSADGRPVSKFTLSMGLADSRVASLRGTTVSPRAPGRTVAGVHVGDQEAGTGVHVYQRVGALDALDTLLRVHPEQRMFAVPLHVGHGQQFRQRLPPGSWMLALLPNDEPSQDPIRLYVDGAVCQSNLLNDPGRLGCEATSHASVVVYRSLQSRVSVVATGYLLVGWLHGGNPTRFVPRVPAMPGSLACAKQFLDKRGYDMGLVSRDRHVLQGERPEGGLGTDARKEWIEVQLVPDTAGGSLRGRAWAVDSYPALVGRPRARNPVLVEPAEGTLTDARQALQECGRGSRGRRQAGVRGRRPVRARSPQRGVRLPLARQHWRQRL
jgi:hypothetical protein